MPGHSLANSDVVRLQGCQGLGMLLTLGSQLLHFQLLGSERFFCLPRQPAA